MKKQIFVIHGGDAFSTYEEYFSYLKNKKVDLERFRSNDWKTNLQSSLGEEYDVLNPRMPNGQNAKYIEWRIWFDKMIPFMEEEVILVGHSLGGIFLAKYLSEETVPKKIKATFLVSAPHDSDGGRPIVEFVLSGSLALLAKQGGELFLYHSKDDPVVDFYELQKFQKELPEAHTNVFENRGHFNQEVFPEIVKDIKSL